MNGSANKTIIKEIIEYFIKNYDLSSTEIVCLFENSIKKELSISDELIMYFDNDENKIFINIIKSDCTFVKIKLTAKTIKHIYKNMIKIAQQISMKRRVKYINQTLKNNRIIVCKFIDETDCYGFVFESQFGRVYLPTNKIENANSNINQFKLFQNYYLFIEKVSLKDDSLINIVAVYKESIITHYVLNKILKDIDFKYVQTKDRLILYTNDIIKTQDSKIIKEYLPHINKISLKKNKRETL